MTLRLAAALLALLSPASACLDGGGLGALAGEEGGDGCEAAAPEHELTPPIDSNFCAWMPRGTITYDRRLERPCYAYSPREDGGYELEELPDAWQGVSRCQEAIRSQKMCRENTSGDAPEARSSCIPGFEIECRRLIPAPIAAAADAGRETFPAHESACTAVTVARVGYPDRTPGEREISQRCLQDDSQRQEPVWCTFLGQEVRVDRGFCDALQGCVAPALAERYPRCGPATFHFPSGPQTLSLDLSCALGAADWSLHHPARGCRAIDINVTENRGNLTRARRWDPMSTIAPGFVAVMEECGLTWGGRYRTASGITGGCDPMHFAYAPGCLL